jgi:hypothetical protein
VLVPEVVNACVPVVVNHGIGGGMISRRLSAR